MNSNCVVSVSTPAITFQAAFHEMVHQMILDMEPSIPTFRCGSLGMILL
jgi:hypothetical protein